MGKRGARPRAEGHRERPQAGTDALAGSEGEGSQRAGATHQVHGASGMVIGDNNTQINYYGDQPASGEEVELPGGIAASPVRTSRVAFWGAPGSGKTTYLAALNLAARDARPHWTVRGNTEAGTMALSEWTIDIVRGRRFPYATVGLDHWSFCMTGRPFGSSVQFDLGILDPSGEYFRTDQAGSPRRRDLIDEMQRCDGIVLFFDPLREQGCHDALDAFKATAAMLEHRLGIRDGERLPHHVAVVIVKYDDPLVLAAARSGGYLVSDPEDPHAFPLVADDRAAAFLDELYRQSNPGSGDLYRRSIEAYFYRERIRYFTVSSVGFHLDRPGAFDWDDYYNIVRLGSGPDAMIRGDIRPVNVLEPMLWLAAPDLYTALTRQRHLVPLSPQAQEAPPARQRSLAAGRTPAAGFTGRVSRGRPDHLVWLVENDGQPDAAKSRLERVWQLTSIASDRNPGLRVSLIYYGSHSFGSFLTEESVEVLAWGSDHAFITAVLYRTGLAGRVAVAKDPARTYALSAQVECALAETVRRLDGSSDVAAVVTVGKRPASPPRMAGESLGLPCPARNDWRELIRRLRDDHRAVLGSLHEQWDDQRWLFSSHRGNAQFWQEMGTHAEADLGSVDIVRFAARLGLVEPGLALPDLPKPPWPFTQASIDPPGDAQIRPGVVLDWDDE